MAIRDFEKSDRDIILNMVDSFYHSPAVSHPIPVAHFAEAFDEMCCGGSERLRGLTIEYEGAVAGFCSLSFSYSTEAGGPVVLIEEIYVSPNYRGHGLGEEAFCYIKEIYHHKAARLRLEVEPDNTRAMELYKRLGFDNLTYVQMVAEDF